MAGCCFAEDCSNKTLSLQDFGCLEREVSRLHSSSSSSSAPSSSHTWGYSHKPRRFVTQSKLQISGFSRGDGLLMKPPQLVWNIPMWSPSVEGLTEKNKKKQKNTDSQSFCFSLLEIRHQVCYFLFHTMTVIIPDSNCSHLSLCTPLACL